jgi:hypothetical protein
MWHSTSGTRNESVTSIGKSSSSCGGMTHLSGRYAKGRATSGTSGEAIAEEGGPGRARRFGSARGLASSPAMMTPATSPGWPRRRRPLQHALVGRELKAQRRLTSAPTKMSPITAFGERQWTVHCGVRLRGARETNGEVGNTNHRRRCLEHGVEAFVCLPTTSGHTHSFAGRDAD